MKKRKSAAASGSILTPPASLQEQIAVAVCRKSNGFPPNHHSRKGSPRRNET
ncbi:hypothetical protein ACFQ3S_03795 [Mucilaginibacter terrae]|uniref:hypothetical protein n=1 Tax=Mucilaginibacter terrae TaxID=1955052 RepID=UPI003633896A